MRLGSVLLVLAGCAAPLGAWGAQGHRMVARAALRDLLPPVAAWFQGQEDALPEHANDPDAWRGSDPLEGPRHFLDCEPYGGPGSVPRDLDAARAQLGPEAFQQDGQVPWTIQDRVEILAGAFQGGDTAQVTYQAAILCHYVADLNVPLHTTQNHDGQLSGQKGVHHRWETGLVERLGDWQPEVRRAALGRDAWYAPWRWLQDSYALAGAVLADDLAASQGERSDLREPGPGYWQEFERLQMPVVKRRLNRAAQRTARMILLAWNRAGQPAWIRIDDREPGKGACHR